MTTQVALESNGLAAKASQPARPAAPSNDWLPELLAPSLRAGEHEGKPYFDAMQDSSPAAGQSPRTVAQTLMESSLFVLLYESLMRPTFVRIFGGPNNGMPSMKGEFNVYEGLLGLRQRVGVWLDLSCGTGFSTAQMVESAPESRHVGLDISPAMLEAAARTVSRLEAGRGNVRLVRGDVYALPFADDSFDGVNNAGSLHLYPDEVGAYREIYRVLKPGGRFVASSMSESERPLGRWFARWTGVRRTRLRTLQANLESVGFGQFRLICWGDIFVVSVVK